MSAFWALSLASLILSYEHYVRGPVTRLKTWWLNTSIVVCATSLILLFTVTPD